MSKASNTFQVGDRVRYNGKRGLDFDKSMMGKVGFVTSDDGGVIVNVDWRGEPWKYGVYRGNIELANDNSPVRTVTRREIVPGTYGDVRVLDVFGASVNLRFAEGTANYAPTDLRAAATLFNELADVLDENQRGAA